MPPNVTSGSPRDFTSRPLQDKDVLYDVGLSQSGISNRLGGDRLSTPSSLVRGDQHPGLAIVNSITEGFRRETSEDDRVYGTDTCAGEESSHGLPVHGKIDANGVTLLDTEGFENVGDSAYFAQEFGIGDVAAFAWLVGFVDDRCLQVRRKSEIGIGERSGGWLVYLVGSLECPTVNAVVGRVDVTLREPRNVSVLKAARAHGVEGTIPMEGLPRHL